MDRETPLTPEEHEENYKRLLLMAEAHRIGERKRTDVLAKHGMKRVKMTLTICNDQASNNFKFVDSAGKKITKFVDNMADTFTNTDDLSNKVWQRYVAVHMPMDNDVSNVYFVHENMVHPVHSHWTGFPPEMLDPERDSTWYILFSK